jgi:P4 family phage/plasmid primase-like protien
MNATLKNGHATDALSRAYGYFDRGWCPLPIPFRSKIPRLEKWETLRLRRDELAALFSSKNNIGILLGAPSRQLIDVDLDWPLAVELAPQYLLPTDLVFGRAGKPRSHWLYILTREAGTKKFSFPQCNPPREHDRKMIVEFRSTGCQTVFPGSIHESGEPIEWADDGEPTEVDPVELLASIAELAQEVRRRLGYPPDETPKPTAEIRQSPMTARPAPPDLIERARKYLAKIPAAVSGQRGHDATILAAGKLIRGFGLEREQALALLREWNQQCQPPWSEKELAHKVDDAIEHPGERGYLQNGGVTETGKSTKSSKPKAKGKRQPKSVNVGDPATGAIPSLKSDAGQTDLANGRRLVEAFGENFRYVPEFKRFIVYDGMRFAVDQGPMMEAKAKHVAELHFPAIARELAAGGTRDKANLDAMLRFARYSSSAKGIGAMVLMARSESGIVVKPEQLDADPWLLNVPNGTLVLRTFTLRPHNRVDLLTKLCPTPYYPDADCPHWRRMVETITAGNQTLIGFLRRLAGLWLTGLSREHIFPVFHGDGANGKTTYLGAIMHMLGTDYSMKAPQELLLVKKNDSHPTERADLFGQRLVVASETEDGRRFAEALVKDLTGGERQRARRVKENNFEFDQTWKIVVSTNHRPRVRGTDRGFWRRLKLVPFTVIIPDDEQDKELPEKLKAEASGILNWCLLGLQEYLAEGLGEPAEVVEATKGYREEMDIVQRFIDECCVLDGKNECRAAACYKAFKSWGESIGEKALTEVSFRKAITDKGIERKKNNGVWYRGLGLLRSERQLEIE